MLEVAWTRQFKRDYRLAMRRGLPIDLLDEVIRMLSRGDALPDEMRDHQLTGRWKGDRECHVMPDWLLVYRVDRGLLTLELIRTGSHSDLFGI